jgi:hypothetical protein
VHNEPQQPGSEPGDVQRVDRGNPAEPGDRGYRAHVAVAKRALSGVAAKAADDRASGMNAKLNRNLGTRAGDLAPQIARHEDLGIARRCAVGQYR